MVEVLVLEVERVTVYEPIPEDLPAFSASWIADPRESESYGDAAIVAIRALNTPEEPFSMRYMLLFEASHVNHEFTHWKDSRNRTCELWISTISDSSKVPLPAGASFKK